MLVQVLRMWNNGILIPRWRWSAIQPVRGHLLLREGRDEFLRRTLRTAHLFEPGQGRELIPPLVDAAVLSITENRMTISGFERFEDYPTVAQTWLIELTLPQPDSGFGT